MSSKKSKLSRLSFIDNDLCTGDNTIRHNGEINAHPPICVLTCHTLKPINKPEKKVKKKTILDAVKDNIVMPSKEQVDLFLRSNPKYLGNYIVKNSSWKSIMEWAHRKEHFSDKKERVEFQGLEFNNINRNINDILPNLFLKDLSPSFNSEKAGALCLKEIKNILGDIICADCGNIYHIEQDYVYQIDIDAQGNVYQVSSMPMSIDFLVSFVAKKKEPVRVTAVESSKLFPVKSAAGEGKKHTAAIAFPIFDSKAEVQGVIEYYKRRSSCPGFTPEDEVIGNAFSVMISVCIALWKGNTVFNLESQHNQVIQKMSQALFDNFQNMETVLKEILKGAKQLVNAQKGCLFTIDHKAEQLVSRVVDTGDYNTFQFCTKSTCHKFPLKTGIIGYVATSGVTVNISDAWSDERFSEEIHEKLGFSTKSILAAPINNKGIPIAVVAMINKYDPELTSVKFSRLDETLFKTFVIYAGIALKIARVFERVKRSETHYSIALEMLSYHDRITDEDKEYPMHFLPSDPSKFTEFSFSPWSIPDLYKPGCAVYMLEDIFENYAIRRENIFEFVMHINKNYRKVIYHNWYHGFSVAHATYSMVKNTSNKFSQLERAAMVFSGLCHDVDHRGKTNQFIQKFDQELASIYSTSIMERHHLHTTITIMQRKGLNLFEKYSQDEYKQALHVIKHCILATDLALFFKYQADFMKIKAEDEISWGNDLHRYIVMAISMTASDLCSMYKPWEIQLPLVMVIMTEFWEQGDDEKAAGLTPIQMMDREFKHELPATQVGFIKGICLPCYSHCASIMPECEELVKSATFNYEKWQSINKLPKEERLLKVRELEEQCRVYEKAHKTHSIFD